MRCNLNWISGWAQWMSVCCYRDFREKNNKDWSSGCCCCHWSVYYILIVIEKEEYTASHGCCNLSSLDWTLLLQYNLIYITWFKQSNIAYFTGCFVSSAAACRLTRSSPSWLAPGPGCPTWCLRGRGWCWGGCSSAPGGRRATSCCWSGWARASGRRW